MAYLAIKLRQKPQFGLRWNYKIIFKWNKAINWCSIILYHVNKICFLKLLQSKISLHSPRHSRQGPTVVLYVAMCHSLIILTQLPFYIYFDVYLRSVSFTRLLSSVKAEIVPFRSWFSPVFLTHHETYNKNSYSVNVTSQWSFNLCFHFLMFYVLLEAASKCLNQDGCHKLNLSEYLRKSVNLFDK